MRLVTSEAQVRKMMPNAFATVEGERDLLEKLEPYIDEAEEFVEKKLTGETIFEEMEGQVETTPVRLLTEKIIVAHAFYKAVPSLDLVLTPNGFGIVSNTNVAPASKERVERLIEALEGQRDNGIEQLLFRLPSIEGWLQTQQANYFTSTLFPNISVCHRLAIRQHRWQEYVQLHGQFVFIESQLAEAYFSQEQMKVFRNKVITGELMATPLMNEVVRQLQSLELMLVTEKMHVHPQAFYDLVNVIREHQETFPEWHASDTAKLYTPAVYINKKENGGYWF